MKMYTLNGENVISSAFPFYFAFIKWNANSYLYVSECLFYPNTIALYRYTNISAESGISSIARDARI